MSYQIGQFRRPQMSSYYDEIDEEYITQGLKQTNVQYGDTQSLVFQNPCITLSNRGVLTSQNFYYLRFKIKRRNDSIQRFYLKLQNSNDSETQDQQQQQIIDEFKVYMNKRGLTQGQAAELVNISRTHLNKVLNGRETPSMALLMRIEKAMEGEDG